MLMSVCHVKAINLPEEHELLAAAAADGTVEMSVRGRVYFSDGLLKTYLVRTINPSKKWGKRWQTCYARSTSR
ncbi:hypothetical protein [Pantoea sp. App145]|uniref:hypothetical protein n=1 Tax=Pantoea sp. App145 TaxID=3071567 RepID=UPI003A812DD0